MLRDETPREIADITAKLLRISEGGYEPGDWSLKVKKALLITCAAAGLLVAVTAPPGLLVMGAGVIGGATIVSVVAGALLAWDSLPAA